MTRNDFGEFIRSRRGELRLSLRAFADLAALDPGNASRLERGLMSAPESLDVLERIASALELAAGSPLHQEFVDVAMASRGRIPADLLEDDEVASRLPILFRTLRNKQLSSEELERLIESIRKA